MRRAPGHLTGEFIRAEARRAAMSADDQAREPADDTRSVNVGANDPTTGAWRAAGILDITSFADGFYLGEG